jgi:hypothetical protein
MLICTSSSGARTGRLRRLLDDLGLARGRETRAREAGAELIAELAAQVTHARRR